MRFPASSVGFRDLLETTIGHSPRRNWRAIEQNVFVPESGVGGKADGGDVVGFGERGLIQRLDIREDVRVLETGRGELVSGEGIKHEGIIGIRECASLISTVSFSVFEAVVGQA